MARAADEPEGGRAPRDDGPLGGDRDDDDDLPRDAAR
jgi:hypothetical protein